MNFTTLNLKPADRIVVPKSGIRLIQHHAICLGQDKDGRHLIAENKIGIGVGLVTAEDFFKDVIEIIEIKRFIGNNYQRKLAVQKALNKLGLPYHLIDYNCQHFANEVQYNRIKSEQVDNFFTAIKYVSGFLFLVALADSFSKGK